MKLFERSYSGKLFRPRPEVHIEEAGELLIVATPWGPRSAAKKTIQIIQDYFLSRQQDEEATSPFSKMTCLSPLANNLRVAVKLANDAIYNEDNKNEYISGVEIFALARSGHEVAWVQVGHPSPLLLRPMRVPLPLGSLQDLSVEFSRGRETLPPLPHKILGLDVTSDFAVESFCTGANDGLLLISRSSLPPDILSSSEKINSLDQASRWLAHDNPELPFWVGLLEL